MVTAPVFHTEPLRHGAANPIYLPQKIHKPRSEPVSNPRDTYAYKKLRRTFLAQHRRTSGVCDKCGVPMDYAGKGRTHKRTATVEHRLPVELYPERALDTAYWSAFCLSCNAAGNRNRSAPTVHRPERDW